MHDNILMSDVEEKPARPAIVSRGTHRVFVRDLELESQIGVFPHEKGRSQRVRLNLELTVRDAAGPIEDRYENVVCYDEVVSAVRRLVAAGHVNLVETLAERIAGLCLEDPRVEGARVRVEKLDVYPDAAGVGVEIEHFRAPAAQLFRICVKLRSRGRRVLHSESQRGSPLSPTT